MIPGEDPVNKVLATNETLQLILNQLVGNINEPEDFISLAAVNKQFEANVVEYMLQLIDKVNPLLTPSTPSTILYQPVTTKVPILVAANFYRHEAYKIFQKDPNRKNEGFNGNECVYKLMGKAVKFIEYFLNNTANFPGTNIDLADANFMLGEIYFHRTGIQLDTNEMSGLFGIHGLFTSFSHPIQTISETFGYNRINNVKSYLKKALEYYEQRISAFTASPTDITYLSALSNAGVILGWYLAMDTYSSGIPLARQQQGLAYLKQAKQQGYQPAIYMYGLAKAVVG